MIQTKDNFWLFEFVLSPWVDWCKFLGKSRDRYHFFGGGMGEGGARKSCFPILGCPRKVGWMVRINGLWLVYRWVISRTCKCGVYWAYIPLILTFYPNFLGHPSSVRQMEHQNHLSIDRPVPLSACFHGFWMTSQHTKNHNQFLWRPCKPCSCGDRFCTERPTRGSDVWQHRPSQNWRDNEKKRCPSDELMWFIRI